MLKYTLLVGAVAAEAETMQKHPILLIPILMRFGLFLVRPVFDYLYHKSAHNLIHLSAHKVELIKIFFTKFKYAPDVLMVGSLAILQWIVG